MSRSNLRNRLLIGGAVVALVIIVVAVVLAATTWGDVNRVTIDRPSTESGGPVAQDEEPSAGPKDDGQSDVTEVGRQIFLLVGSDSRDDLASTEGFGEFEGQRADVMMVLIKDGANTGLLSIPRDLLVENPCGGPDDKLGTMLEGCEVMNGPTLLTVAVEKTIGQPVNHFALIDLAGFQKAVDAVGGYEICVDNPVRDTRANLDLPAGCTLADGAQTLAWMRSRHTQELTANGWRILPGMNDLVRNERQRAFLIDMMGRIADFTSPQDMAAAAQAVAPFVTVDSELSLLDAANLAWTLRGYGSDSVVELEVPVYDATSENAGDVLLPSTPVDEIVTGFLSSTAADAGTAVLGAQD
jgi:LCP family protein required for cell wall assembly